MLCSYLLSISFQIYSSSRAAHYGVKVFLKLYLSGRLWSFWHGGQNLIDSFIKIIEENICIWWIDLKLVKFELFFTIWSKNNNKTKRNVIFFWRVGVRHKFILSALVHRGWFPKVGNMLHSKLRQDLNNNKKKNQKNNI